MDRSVRPGSAKLPTPDRSGLRKGSLAEALRRPPTPRTPQPSTPIRWSKLDKSGEPVATGAAVAGTEPALRSTSAAVAAEAKPVLVSPADNAVITALTTTLTASVSNPLPGATYQYRFTVCPLGGTCTTAQQLAADSGWNSASTYTIPTGRLFWDRSYVWEVAIRDNPYMGTILNPRRTFHTAVPLPADARSGRDSHATFVQGTNISTGHYVTSATDASVASIGAPLELTRAYTSGDNRAGAFGTGWSSVLDMKVTVTSSGPRVRMADGHDEVFGINPDGTFAPAPGNSLRTLTRCATCAAYTAKDAAGTTYEVDTSGLVAMTDAQGRQTTVTRDSSKRITALTDLVSGRRLAITWTGATAAAVSVEPAPQGKSTTWRYTYSGGKLTSVCDPRGAGHCAGYSYANTAFPTKLTSVVTPRGKVHHQIGYASTGLVATVTGVATGTTTFTRTAISGGTRVAVRDARSSVSTYELDGYGRAVKLTDPTGAVQTWAYDVGGQLARYVTGAGSALELTYDEQSRVTERKTWRDATTYTLQRFEYSVWHQGDYPDLILAGTSTGSRDARTPDSYDDLNKVRYDLKGRVVESTSLGLWRRFEYTTGTEAAVGGGTMPAGLLRWEKGYVYDPYVYATYSYDSLGNLREKTDAVGLRTTYEYDPLGRPVAATEFSDSFPAGLRTETTYDETGRVVSATTPQVSDPVSGTTRRLRSAQSYDADGNPTVATVTDLVSGESQTSRQAYDDAGRVVSVTGPDQVVTGRLSYDAVGNLATRTDALGAVTRFTYSSRNELTSTVAVGYRDPANPGSPRDVTLGASTYDAAGRLATSTDSAGQVLRYAYWGDDRLKSVTALAAPKPGGGTADLVLREHEYDALGNVTRMRWNGGRTEAVATYDSRYGRLASVAVAVPAVGDSPAHTRTLTYLWDSNVNQIHREQLDNGEYSDYRYDRAGRVTTTSQGTEVSRLTRDQRGQVVGVTEGVLGGTVSYQYDPAGNLVRMQAPAVPTRTATGTETIRPTTSWGYDAFGRVAVEQAPGGARTSYAYDPAGRLAQVTAPTYTPAGGTPLTSRHGYRYDAAGRLIGQLDPAGRETVTEYDTLGRQVRRTAPALADGGPVRVTTVRYDDAGRVSRLVDPTGAVGQFGYDTLGRRVSETTLVRSGTGSVARTSQFGHDVAGNVVSATDSAGGRSTAVYNALDELVRTTDPDGVATSYQRDQAGRVTRTTDALGRSVVQEYDAKNRPTVTTYRDAAGNPMQTSTVGYSALGEVKLTGADGSVTRQAYDAIDRLVSTTLPDGTTTRLGYDLDGRTVAFTDERGHETRIGYTPWDQVEQVTEPATSAHPAEADRTWRYTYDVRGLPVTETRPGGVRVDRTFDHGGNLLREAASGGGAANATRQYGYDVAGRLTGAAHPGGTQTFSYDDRGLLTGATGPAGASTYGYDAAGRLTGRTDPAGSMAATWSPAGRLATVTEAGGGTTSHNYDTAGQLTAQSYAGGLRRSYTYDGMGRLATDRIFNAAAVPVYSLGYEHDAAGKISKRTVGPAGVAGAGATTYGYDKRGRLTSWTGPDAAAHAIGWDAAGNQTSADGVTRSYDQRNRLLTDGGTTYTYTPRGTIDTRKIGSTTTTLQHDALDRLTSDGSTTFQYDSLDRLASAGQTAFRYAGTDPDPVSAGTRTWLRDPGGQLLGTNGTPLISDPRGDVVAGTDGQTVTGTRQYQPFGAATGTGGDLGGAGYQGDWTAPSGLVHMGARWYDPGTGRFTSRDDATLDVGEQNRYSYAGGDPIGGTDPTGHFLQCATPVTAPICIGAGAGSLAGPGGTVIGAAAGAFVGGAIGAGIWAGSLVPEFDIKPINYRPSGGYSSYSYSSNYSGSSYSYSGSSYSYSGSSYSYSGSSYSYRAPGANQPSRYSFGAAFTQVNAGLTQMNSGLTQMNAGLVGANAGMAQANAGIAQAIAGIAQANAGITQANAGITQANAGIAQMNAALVGAIAGMAQANAGVDQMISGIAQMNAALVGANAGIAGAIAGVGQMISGVDQMNAALVGANAGMAQANAGVGQMISGMSGMNAGFAVMIAALNHINTTLPKMVDGPPPVLGEPPVGHAAPTSADLCGAAGYAAGCAVISTSRDNTCAGSGVKLYQGSCAPTTVLPAPGKAGTRAALDGPALAGSVGGGAKEPPTSSGTNDPCRDSTGGGSPDDEVGTEGRTEKHHSWPKYLGPPHRQSLVPLSRTEHYELHQSLNDFFDDCTPIDGKTMRAKANWSGKLIRQQYSEAERALALARFYRGPGSRFTTTAAKFFEQFSSNIPPFPAP
ncbi:RHS repeat-associated core domain-containing protein [Micromonospora peucetia]|uniref:RHS repeat-associated core domain-containing protein n=1 Tax=Micromonospora peucetia TaxID=47871 RepID=UPI003331EEC4